MKKLACILFAAVLLLTACTASVTPTTAPTSGPTEAPAEKILLTRNGETEYTVIKPIDMGDGTKDLLKDFTDWAKDATGVKFKSTFVLGEGKTKRIVLGLVSELEETYEGTETMSEGDWEVSLRDNGDTLLVTATADAALAEAVAWLKANLLADGNLVAAANLKQQYFSAPLIKGVSPEKGVHFANCDVPNFTVKYASGCGLDTVVALVDGSPVPTVIGVNTVTGTMTGLAVGSHTLKITLTDKTGKSAETETEFSVTGKELHVYRGEIHSHTAESDGKGTIQEAYDFVKSETNLDFFATTDHNYFYTDEYYKSVQVAAADANNDAGTFVSFYGQEYTSRIEDGAIGHLNVFNSTHVYSAVKLHLQELYDAVVADEDCFCQFNHPGQSWGDFNDFTYYAPADEKFCLFEFQGGESALYEERWIYALSQGWHLSPTFNEDNHAGNWTKSYTNHTVILASTLNRTDLIYAIRHNRTYTTSDLTLTMDYRINDRVMGSRLVSPDTLKISVALSTQQSKGFGKIQLIGEDGVVIAETNGGNRKDFTWELELEPNEDYYYVKIDSNGIWAISAPIWVEQADGMELTDMVKGREGSYDTLTNQVVNNTGMPLTDVKASYWLVAADRGDVSGSAAYTVDIGTVEAGATAEIVGKVILGRNTSNRVICIVTGKDSKGRTHSSTTTARLQPMLITETSFVSKGDEYNFIELYNNSDTACETNLWLVMMNQCGMYNGGYSKVRYDIKNITFEPYTPTVIWVKKPGNDLGVSDFNARFGTKLVKGKTIFVIESEVDAPVLGSPVEWALVTSSGYELVGAHWNYDDQRGKQSQIDTSMQYGVVAGPSRYLKAIAVNSTPTPGSLIDGQVPTVK